MAKALWQGAPGAPRSEHLHHKAWSKRMSDHVAAGLLVYTGLHIFVTMHMISTRHGSILPYFGLVFLVAAIIPACRMFERRWEVLSVSGKDEAELQRLFNRDRIVLWLAAIGLPLLLTALVKAALALF